MISVHQALARLLVHASDQHLALDDSTDKRSAFVYEHRGFVAKSLESFPHIGGKLGLVEFKNHDLLPLM